MSQTVIAFMIALGAGTWIYSKFYSRTGGNQKSALTAAGLSGVGIFIFVLILLSFILPD